MTDTEAVTVAPRTGGQSPAKVHVDLAHNPLFPTVEDWLCAWQQTTDHQAAMRQLRINLWHKDAVLAGSRLVRMGTL